MPAEQLDSDDSDTAGFYEVQTESSSQPAYHRGEIESSFRFWLAEPRDNSMATALGSKSKDPWFKVILNIH